jgi:phage shock protein C
MARRPLRRSRRHRILAGVCGGIADSYGWSPTVVRILWIIFGLLPVIPGTVLYLVLWIIVPVAED